MNALKGEEFPELPLLQSERGFSLPAGTLREMMGAIFNAALANW